MCSSVSTRGAFGPFIPGLKAQGFLAPFCKDILVAVSGARGTRVGGRLRVAHDHAEPEGGVHLGVSGAAGTIL